MLFLWNIWSFELFEPQCLEGTSEKHNCFCVWRPNRAKEWILDIYIYIHVHRFIYRFVLATLILRKSKCSHTLSQKIETFWYICWRSYKQILDHVESSPLHSFQYLYKENLICHSYNAMLKMDEWQERNVLNWARDLHCAVMWIVIYWC